jgi:hypothetical protein
MSDPQWLKDYDRPITPEEAKAMSEVSDGCGHHDSSWNDYMELRPIGQERADALNKIIDDNDLGLPHMTADTKLWRAKGVE